MIEYIGLSIMLWLYVGGVTFAYVCGRSDGAKAAFRSMGRRDLADRLP